MGEFILGYEKNLVKFQLLEYEFRVYQGVKMLNLVFWWNEVSFWKKNFARSELANWHFSPHPDLWGSESIPLILLIEFIMNQWSVYIL